MRINNGLFTANNVISLLLTILICIIGWLWIQNTAEVKAITAEVKVVTEKYNNQNTSIAEIKADQRNILKEVKELKQDFREYMQYQRRTSK